MIIHILGADHPVVVPRDYATRRDLVSAWAGNSSRGAAAILGECVPSLWEPKPKGGGLAQPFSLRSCAYDAGAYGGRCWDVLHAAGVHEADFIGAAVPVFTHLAGLVSPSVPEVKERVDFTGASAEG